MSTLSAFSISLRPTSEHDIASIYVTVLSHKPGTERACPKLLSHCIVDLLLILCVMLIENPFFALDTAPYDKPRTFAVKDHNSSCVSLEWAEPEFPNGLITNYTVSCLRFITQQNHQT